MMLGMTIAIFERLLCDDERQGDNRVPWFLQPERVAANRKEIFCLNRL
jgi:hypothetical protein